MTLEAIKTMLEEAGLPLAYDHFAEGEAPPPPFLVFLCPADSVFFADNRNYFHAVELHVELYADRKDPALEARLEAIFDAHELPFTREETWLASERLYETLYTMDV